MDEAKDIDIKILGPFEIVVDGQKNIRVMQGVPTTVDQQGSWNPPGTEMIIIPNKPYVFKVDELTVRDRDHPNEQLKDVTLLMAHGRRVGNRWKFVEGGDVVETVEAYNRSAPAKGLKPVEFLVVCNRAAPNLLGIRVGEFDTRAQLAYAVGEDVHLTLGGKSKREEGRVSMEVSVDKTFFGLNELIQHKRLQERIRILP